MPDCVFCQIVAKEEPARIVREGEDYLAFEPLRPHTPGHTLFIPKKHAKDAAEDAAEAAIAFVAACLHVRELDLDANIITSVGAAATQTVFHTHVHVVPRGPRDGLRRSWPWRIRQGELLGPNDTV